MARYTTPTPEQEQLWRVWLAEQPTYVATIGERFDPWSLYLLKSSNHRVTVCGFNSNSETHEVTVQVNVTGEFNVVAFDRTVFGVDPDDLGPCALPKPGERLGAILTDPALIDEYIDLVRPAVLAAKQRRENEI